MTSTLPTRDSKHCRSCGAVFYRRDDCGPAHWARRKVCSYFCQHGPAMLERFWARVEITESCWLWRGGIAGNGYGRFYPRKKGHVPAHVFAWETTNAQEVPEGLELDHLCRTLICVRPDHLEPVTHRTNMLRGNGVASLNAAKSACIHGHPYTPENTIWRPLHKRRCRTCENGRRCVRQPA
jgi:hypothetical protein